MTDLLTGTDLLAGYDSPTTDEAVEPGAGPRPRYEQVLGILTSLGAAELTRRQEQIRSGRDAAGVVFTAVVNGAPVTRPFPLDVVPRLISGDVWERLGRAGAQRTRALNAFLADVYGDGAADAGPGRIPAIVAAGIVPDALVRGAPGYRPEAVGLAPGGGPRITVHGLDLLSDDGTQFQVLEDNLQVPSGLAYAAANRDDLRAALPELFAAAGLRREGPEAVGPALLAALRSARPPRCPREEPSVVVLSDGEANSAFYEHAWLARAMGVPVITPDQLRYPDGGIAAAIGADTVPVDVIYRRLGADELLGFPKLLAAARAGRVSIANAPGNGVADDKAIYAFVGPMIRFYLGEEPLLADVGTWVLADPGQYSAVRGRMAEVVVKPVDGSGGDGVMIGPDLTAEQVAVLEATVARAPERFIAQNVIRFSTHPTFLADEPALRARHVDLRLFVLCGRDEARAAPVALTRVALRPEGLLVNSSQGGGSKDTWIGD